MKQIKPTVTPIPYDAPYDVPYDAPYDVPYDAPYWFVPNPHSIRCSIHWFVQAGMLGVPRHAGSRPANHTLYKPKWLASNIWIRDVFLLCLSDPSTFGAGGPNQNTSRIQHKEVFTPFLIYDTAFQAVYEAPSSGTGRTLARGALLVHLWSSAWTSPTMRC